MFKIFTEASKQKGFGHISRLLGVCKRLENEEIGFNVFLDADNVAKELFCKDFITFEKWNDTTRIRKLIKNDDIILVDSYSYDIDFLFLLKELAKKVIVIDDNIRLDYTDVIIINPNYFGEYLRYPNDKNNVYYLGKKYTLLRDEFIPDKDRAINKNVKSVLISMGGTDILNITHIIMDNLLRINDDISMKVVATEAYDNLKDVKKRIRKQDQLITGATAKQMSDLMKSVDFAICSAGGTTNELIKMVCPAIIIAVADNQQLNALYLKKKGLVETFDVNTMDKIKKLFEYTTRKALIDKMKENRSESNAVDTIIKIIKYR